MQKYLAFVAAISAEKKIIAPP